MAALQVSDVQTAFEKYKRDIDDVKVETGLFNEWMRFAIEYIYDKGKRIDPERFIKSTTYNVVIPPQSFDFPTDLDDMEQTGTGIFKYTMRKQLMAGFNESSDSGITYTDASATSAYNTTIYVEGGSSRGYTGDAADTMKLTFGTALDFTSFDDSGAVSPTNDKVSIWVYIGNDIPTSATLGMYSTSAKTNGFTYAYTDLVAGWNRIVAAKSAFTDVGTGDWSSIGYIECVHAGGTADTNIYWDKLDLVESEVNGNGQTNQQLGTTGYGSKLEGFYFTGNKIAFTGDKQITDKYYVQRYIPIPPTIDDEDDYLTVDKTASGQQIVEQKHLKYMVKAIDVWYEQWDNNPTAESISDFRYARELSDMLSGYNRLPQVSTMENPTNNF